MAYDAQFGRSVAFRLSSPWANPSIGPGGRSWCVDAGFGSHHYKEHPSISIPSKLILTAQSRANPGVAGASGILRDNNGRWLSGFSHNIGWTTAIAAELWGALIGPEHARMLYFRRVILVHDSESVCHMIRRTIPCTPHVSSLIRDILIWLAR